MRVHASAIVSQGATLGKGVEIGAYAVIGGDVQIGSHCRIGSHVTIQGHTVLGDHNVVHSFATLGVEPQDLKYKGEPTGLRIGSSNVLREYVNISIGTESGGGMTTIGDHNLIMAYSHVAHDCHIASGTILSNAATLGGHVTIEDYAIIGAFSGVHQFCRVGRHAFVGGYTVLTKDALPYFKAVGNRARVFGVNSLGLKRHGFDEQSVERIRQIYRILFQSKLNTSQAVERMRRDLPDLEEANVILSFIQSSKRGVVKR